ncbi:MAG: hypothetical protein V5A14_04840 [Desulfohalobiaceae bacterium]
MLHGESIHSMLPHDLPLWRPDHAVFFGVLYIVLLTLVSGVGFAVLRSIYQTFTEKMKR